MRHIDEKFDTIDNLLRDPANNHTSLRDLLSSFSNNGGEILGQGKFATVLRHPSWKHVIKIFSDDVPYLKFVRFCIKNPRPSFPVFYDLPRRIIPNYKRHRNDTYLYVVRTELLNPISIREYDNINFYIAYAGTDFTDIDALANRFDNWKSIKAKLIDLDTATPSLKQFKLDYNFMLTNANCGTLDWTSKNILKRKSGEYVLADPFWVGETPYQTYDKLLSAEIGYEHDEYENDTHKDILGGTKYKKPKPVKSVKQKTKSDDEVPF
jgi:hypothetical protein